METGGGAPGSLAAGRCGGWSNDFGFRVGRHAVIGSYEILHSETGSHVISGSRAGK